MIAFSTINNITGTAPGKVKPPPADAYKKTQKMIIPTVLHSAPLSVCFRIPAALLAGILSRPAPDALSTFHTSLPAYSMRSFPNHPHHKPRFFPASRYYICVVKLCNWWLHLQSSPELHPPVFLSSASVSIYKCMSSGISLPASGLFAVST